jgi:hypothetical protein
LLPVQRSLATQWLQPRHDVQARQCEQSVQFEDAMQ